MTSPRPPTAFLIMDANVLIDYCAADRTVLKSISDHVGKIVVPSIVLAEVSALDEATCDDLGIEVFDPSVDVLMAAATRPSGLSVEDFTCLTLAHENGWVCVTNDGRLRSCCKDLKVKLLWGLEPMASLVHAEHLSIDEAISIAEAIHESNPYFITRAIVDRFVRSLKK